MAKRLNRAAVHALFLAVALLPTVPSSAQLRQSSVPGLLVRQGFDAEIFATGLTLPGKIVLDSNGDLVVASQCTRCPVVRVSRASGRVIAASNSYSDPDGVAIDSQGRVFVAGGSQVTIANSLNGAVDQVFRSGHRNLQDVAIDSSGRIVLMELSGQVLEVTPSSAKLVASLGRTGARVSFDGSDRLYASRREPGGLWLVNGGVRAVTDDPIDPNGIVFGPGGKFGEDVFVSEPNSARIRSVATATGAITPFAEGLAVGNSLAFGDADSLFLTDRSTNPGRLLRVFPTSGGCLPGGTTLCIDLEPGDERFQITAHFESVLGGGVEGDARATPLAPLGIDNGGIFSFFDPRNPEVLVKVLDGCAVNDHIWVFYAATTNVGFELVVRDTLSGMERNYLNPDLMTAEAVTDTLAFALCP